MPRLLPARLLLIAALVMLANAPAALTAQAPAPAAPAEDIRGPKPMVEIPQPEKPPVALWPGVVGGVLTLTVAVLMWRWHCRRKQRKSPADIALRSLGELEASQESMSAETFACLTANAVRQYIGDRFGLAAPRRTTEEFLRDLAHEQNPALSGESDHLRVFLKACDLAKFAASQLDVSQRGDLIQAARGFVTVTSAPASNSKSKVVTP